MSGKYVGCLRGRLDRKSRLGLGYKMIAIFSGIICIMFVWYYSNLVLRTYHGSMILAMQRTLEHNQKSGLPEVAALLMPFASSTRDKFLKARGYWKDLHRFFLALGQVELFVNQDLVSALKQARRSLEVHPYFLNGYKLLANIYRLVGSEDRAAACTAVSESLLRGERPSREDVCRCDLDVGMRL